MRRVLPPAVVVALVSCGRHRRRNRRRSISNKLTDDFMYGALALSPVSATQAGYHEHNGVRSTKRSTITAPAGIEAQRRFYQGIQDAGRGRRRTVARPGTAGRPADHRATTSACRCSSWTRFRTTSHNPTVYVELAGNALFIPLHAEVRAGGASDSSTSSSASRKSRRCSSRRRPIWSMRRKSGTASRVKRTRATSADRPDAARGRARVAEGATTTAPPTKAIAALKDFNTFLEDTLSKKTSDWRLGKEKYARKFAYALATDKTPEQLLAEAEADLQSDARRDGEARAPKTVKQALDEIATPARDARDLHGRGQEDARRRRRRSCARRRSLTLPPRSNLQVIDTPEFMRGIYARRRLQSRAAARARARRVLLDHADSEDVAEGRASNPSCASTTVTVCSS